MFDINDYELVSLAQECNEDAIAIIHKKYQPLLQILCRKHEKRFQKIGLDSNDLMLECSIALEKAVNSYNDSANVQFKTFLTTCLEKQIISVFRKYEKEKNRALNEAIPLDEESIEGEGKTLHDVIQSNRYDPVKQMIEDENCSRLFKKIISQLSELEECVFLLKIQNFTYQEIANILDKDEKSIDNTMQRIRLKAKKIMALL